MLLSDLSKTINTIKIYNFSKDRYFTSITSNSKLTNNITILGYDKNSKAKKKYIIEAIKNNTPAIVTNKFLKYANVPQFLVSSLDSEIELIIKKIYKNMPSRTIAVTGTNGKTSVVWYVSKILSALKYNNSTVGTLGHYKNGKKINEFDLTTPPFEELYKYGSSAKKNNTFIFEASSHALDQNRIRNYPINIAAITNITKDHLDYHKNIFEYKKAKLKLFKKHLLPNGYAIINARIKNILPIIKNIKNKKIKTILFGKKNIFFKRKDNFLRLIINKNEYNINNLKLNSYIELENLECAIACCLALKIKEKKIINSLSTITNPPGRFQKLNYKKKKSTIIIDYAHTPDALEKTLKSLYVNNKKPVLLFGCGGERDKTKRKTMGKIAKNFSSKTYVTDDNPRNENPSTIRKNIIKYCPNAIEIPNRKDAIKRAIKELKNNDTLIIAGKGHENLQIIKNKKYKFDDFKLAKKIINT